MPEGEKSKGEQLYDARREMMNKIERQKHRDEVTKARLLGTSNEGIMGEAKLALTLMYEK